MVDLVVLLMQLKDTLQLNIKNYLACVICA